MSILDDVAGADSSSNPTASALSNDDYQNILRTVYGEAGNQGPAGWSAVTNVIKNRLAAGTYGSTASDVVQSPKQFSVWNNGTPALPDDATSAKMLPVIKAVFEGDSTDPTNGATNYYANKGPNAIAPPSWAQGASNPIQIGDQVFMKAPGGGSGVNSSTTPTLAQPQAPTDATGGNGAFNANFLTGGLGTLFGMSPQNSSALGSRLARAGAALASISSPAQAQILSGLIPKPVNDEWTDVGAAPNNNGRIQQNKVTGSVRYQPYPSAAGGNDDTVMKADDTKSFNQYHGSLVSAADTIDEINNLQHTLATNPKVYGHYNVSNDPFSFIANSEGMSTDQSQFVKSLNSAIAKGVIAIQQGGHFSRPTNAIMATEKQSLAPNGALSDPITTWQALERLKQQMQEQYNTSILSLKSQKKAFGSNLPFDPDAYDKTVQTRWSDAGAANTEAYKSLQKWHDDKVNGVAPTGIVPFIKNLYSKSTPGVSVVPPQPSPPVSSGPYPSTLGIPWQPGMPIQ